MVDVDTAMRASAFDKRKRGRGGSGDKEEPKSRELEPFKPDEHAVKEVADAYSMWLVIVYGLSVALFMRYVFMPTTTEPSRIHWVLPVSLAATVPSLHKLVLPSRIVELYTGGNWFRACFLFIFSWLALTFVLSNPPLSDIAPPTTSNGIDIQDADGIIDSSWRGGEYKLEIDRDEVHVVMGLGVADNIDSESAQVLITLTHKGNTLILANDTAGNLTDAMGTFDEQDSGDWLRGNETTITRKTNLGPKVSNRAEDVSLAWDLGLLGPGTYDLHIEMSESRDNMGPWEVNKWTADWKIKISQTG
jgi:hypothetical protein